MKRNLIFAALMLAAGVSFVSCGNAADELENQDGQSVAVGKAHVRLVCGMGVSVSQQKAMRRAPMRAALTANGRTITDLYILDYDKKSGKLLQVLHQTSDAEDFAEPDLTLDYGEHTLKVIATRSDRPTLLDASGAAWNVTANVLTPVSAAVPVSVTSDKTSDTFGAEKDVTVGVGQSATVSITLDRLVAKLVVNSTDDFPADASTIDVTLEEYRQLSFTSMDVIGRVRNQRTTDVSGVAGKHGTTINYFFLTPADGYTTDITFTTNSTKGTPYSTITVTDVPLERNKVTTISGSLYNHRQGFHIGVNDEWDNESNEVNI